MEPTYMVRGADGKEYGPATLEQLGAWIREGRLMAQQQIKRSDTDHWAQASSFAELQPLFPIPTTAAPATLPTTPAQTDLGAAAAQLRSGASWFYWIAGLSLINSGAAFFGSTWHFIIGLGMTQLIDEFGQHINSGGKAIALVLDLLAAAMFILFGIFANKAHRWAFIVGMILFGLDGLIFLLVQDWIGVIFHLFVLYCLFRGFAACRRVKAA